MSQNNEPHATTPHKSQTRLIITIALVVAVLGFVWMFVQYSGVLPGDRGTPVGAAEQPELEGPPA